MEIISIVITGLAVGSVYALIALAINIVFSARRVVNFGQGDLVMLSGLLGVALIAGWGWPYFLGLLGSMVVIALVAIIIERVAIRPLPREESSIAWVLSIVAVAIITSNAGQLIFGAETRTFPSIFGDMHFDAAGLRFDPNQLLAIGATAVFLLLFQFLLNNTLHGKALKAAARDADMAMLLGINVSRYIAGGFAIAGVTAVIASFLIGPLTFINANFGFALGIKGFAAAALGGLGTLGGAVLGGLILGLAETLSSAYLGSDVKDIIVLSVLYLVLIFRPTGLVGEANIAKV
jgi:branched-chain amino acid transport system permease protein